MHSTSAYLCYASCRLSAISRCASASETCIAADDPETITQTVVDLVQTRLPRKFKVEPRDHWRTRNQPGLAGG